MGSDLRKQIFANLHLKETDELIEIWTTNDHVEWSETAFDVVKELLKERLGEIPPQNEPVFEHAKQEIFYDDDVYLSLDKFTNTDNAPLFYKPKEVLWANIWLNRIAVAAVVFTILVSIPEIRNMQIIVLSYFPDNMVWNFVSWFIALVVGGFLVVLQCFVVYFSLKSLALILKILMEMEFKSRAVK
jgi:hypothetical protein